MWDHIQARHGEAKGLDAGTIRRPYAEEPGENKPSAPYRWETSVGTLQKVGARRSVSRQEDTSNR